MEKFEKARAQTLMTAASASMSTGVKWDGGKGAVNIWGTFGGTTAVLWFSKDAGVSYNKANTVDTSSTFTEGSGCIFENGPCLLKFILTGGSGISVSADICPV